jgi:ribosomal protein S18 acetylase RimI-like enzyme
VGLGERLLHALDIACWKPGGGLFNGNRSGRHSRDEHTYRSVRDGRSAVRAHGRLLLGSCYLSDLAVDKACQGQGIGKRLIEETRTAAGGTLTTTLLLSAPTAMTYYQGIKMPQADNCFLYRRER